MIETNPIMSGTADHADKKLLRAFKGRTNGAPPIWLMRQAGRFLPEYREVRKRARDFLDLCYSPEMAIEVTLQPLRRFPLDAAILFADILLIPHALGQEVAFEEGRGPVLTPIRSRGELENLRVDGIDERLEPVYETVAGVARALPDGATLIGFAGAPWTVATYMVEGGGSPNHYHAKRWAYRDTEGFERLIDILVDATSHYLMRQVEAGAEVLQIFDSWAGSLPAPWFHRLCIEPTKEIVRRVKARHPGIMIIGFPRGAGPLYRDYVEQTGIDGIGIDYAVPAGWAAEELQDRVLVQGNLDPVVLVEGGEHLFRDAGRILNSLSGGPHIFNLGHGILPDTPPQHVAELCDFVRHWRPQS